MIRNVISMLIVSAFSCGCVSKYYCSDELYAANKERFDYSKCSASVAADVVVGTLAVVGAVAAAQGGGGYSGGESSYEGNCACPADLDANGNRCGLRSAYSREGGASPSCIGRL